MIRLFTFLALIAIVTIADRNRSFAQPAPTPGYQAVKPAPTPGYQSFQPGTTSGYQLAQPASAAAQQRALAQAQAAAARINSNKNALATAVALANNGDTAGFQRLLIANGAPPNTQITGTRIERYSASTEGLRARSGGNPIGPVGPPAQTVTVTVTCTYTYPPGTTVCTATVKITA